MPTTKFTATQDWQLIADADVEFMAQNQSSDNIRFTFADSEPDADAPYYILSPGDVMPRGGCAGAVYIRQSWAGPAGQTVVVTTS